MIDAHTHIFDEEAYASYKKRANGRVEKALTIHIAPHGSTSYPSLESIFKFAEDKKDIAIIAGVNVMGDLHAELTVLETLLAANKIIGLKLYPGYQLFFSNDPKVIPIAQLCARYKKPLIIHTGDVEDQDRVSLLRYSHPIFVDDLAIAVPDCTIVIAHLGFPYMLEAANVLSKNQNVFGDISGTLMDEPGVAPLALIKQYSTDLTRIFTYFPNIRKKILFGTDYSGKDLSSGFLTFFNEYIEVVEKVFTEEERDWVYSGLAKKLFNL